MDRTTEDEFQMAELRRQILEAGLQLEPIIVRSSTKAEIDQRQADGDAFEW
jgi:hypothetical protein